jgi:hypothetical protein
MRRSTLLLCALALGGCNADTFAPADGGSDATPGDASPDVPSVGGDGGPTLDGGAGDAMPPPRFCQTTTDAKFCADFDDPNDAGAGFGQPGVDTGFALTYQGVQAYSLPTAMRTDVPASSTGQAEVMTALGTTTTTGASTAARLDVELYITGIQPGPYGPLDVFSFGAVAPNFLFALSVAAQWELRNVKTNQWTAVTGTIPSNEWVHVTLSLGLDASAGSATLTVTSTQSTATAALGPVATIPVAPPTYPILVFLGPVATGPVGQTPSFFYDNVVVHYQ